MKADITRSTYNKNKKYTKVNAQQGRIQVDADWNEQLDINEHFNKTLLCDIVGETGTSIDDPGFKITITPPTTDTSTNTNTQNTPFPIEKSYPPCAGRESMGRKEHRKPSFTIGKGRYYVDGIICENNSNTDALEQEDLPYSELFEENFIVPKETGVYVVYLDVWQRHITSLEDPTLMEVALGQTDTTTRTKNIWQVKTLKISSDSNPTFDAQIAFREFKNQITQSDGTASVRLKPVTQGNCEPTLVSEYSGDENRLYRVEIHQSNKPNNNTESTLPDFKWSRENAIVAAKILQISGPTEDKKVSIVVENRGKDDFSKFRKGHWIEITDEYSELWNMPGPILQIDDVEENIEENQSILQVTVSNGNESSLIDYMIGIVGEGTYVSKLPKVRRWNAYEGQWRPNGNIVSSSCRYPGVSNQEFNHRGLCDGVSSSHSPHGVSNKRFNHTGSYIVAPPSKNPPVNNACETSQDDENYIDIEDGIQFKLQKNQNYVAGDYWLIPARTITKSIEWPTDDSNETVPAALPSMMEHHYCALALLNYNDSKGELEVICDFRNFFSTTNTALHFYYMSGDGQRVTPDNIYIDPVLPGVPLLLCVGAKIGDMLIGKEFQDRLFVRFEIVDKAGVGALVSVDSAESSRFTCKRNTLFGGGSHGSGGHVWSGSETAFVDVPIVAGVARCGWVFRSGSDWAKGDLNKVTPGKQAVSATLMWRTGPEMAEVRVCHSVAPVFFNATFAQLELRYKSGYNQNIQRTHPHHSTPGGLDSNVFCDSELTVYLVFDGLPLTSEALCASVLSLWRANVRFKLSLGGRGRLIMPQQFGNSIISTPVFNGADRGGLVARCCLKLDDGLLPQSAVAELANFKGNTFGSALFFNIPGVDLHFYYISGDGQTITNNNIIHGNEDLPVSPLWLRVGAKVGNLPLGNHPHNSAAESFFVRFSIVEGSSRGRLVSFDSVAHPRPSRKQKAQVAGGSVDVESVGSKNVSADPVDVPIVAGEAKCGWVFTDSEADNHSIQTVSATLMRRIGSKGAGGVCSCSVAPVFFNATFAQPASQNVQPVPQVTSGLVRFTLNATAGEGLPFLSSKISHELECDVPPAIILYLLSPTPNNSDNVPSNTEPNERTALFSDDFWNYHWSDMFPDDKYLTSLQFKAVHIDKEYFQIMMKAPADVPAAEGEAHLYLRWWAIHAQPKGITSVNFERIVT